MKIILKKTVPKIGAVGEVKEVSDGYARNYLIPGGMAVPYTAESARKANEHKNTATRKERKVLRALRTTARAVRATELVLEERVSPNGKLYAAVNAKRIVDALGGLGIDIQAKWVRLDDPIKEPGTAVIDIDFGHGITAVLRCKIMGIES